jgi:hypothetical protein
MKLLNVLAIGEAVWNLNGTNCHMDLSLKGLTIEMDLAK